MSWCPMQMPKIGSLPRSCLTSPITGVTSSGLPGPFDSTMPSGWKAMISSTVES